MTEPAERSELGGERARPTPTIELTATEIPGQEKVAKAGEQTAGAAGGAKASSAETPAARARAAASSAPPRAKPRNRAWPIITAGVAGACIVVIAGALWLSRANQRSDQTAALASQLATVQAELGALAARPQVSARDAQRTAELATRLAAVEQKLQALADSAKRATSSEQPQQQLSALTSRLAALEQTLAPSGDFAMRFGKLEAAVAAAPVVPVDPASAERLGSAEKNLQSLDARTNEFARRLAAIEARLSDTATRAQVNEERSLENQAHAGIDEAARLAVLADALAVKVGRGQPFATELSAIKPFVTQQSLLEPLAPMAETGVPTAATLSRELAALVPAVAATIGPRDDSLIDRLQATAERLVRVRPVNAEAGDDPRNVLARIEAKARQNDIDGALAELSRLPGQARAPAMEWIRKAEARRAAVDASRRISAASMNALGKPASQ